jgi:hypothetical protein
MQAATNTKPKGRSKKTTAVEAGAAVQMQVIASSAIEAPMDADLAALLGVLTEGSTGETTIEEIIQSSAPIVEDVLLEAGTVEVIEVEALPVIEQPHIEVIEAAMANLDVQDHYSLVPADAAPHEGATPAELEAATPAAVEVVPAVAKVRAPRVHYANKTDRIVARLGDNLGDYMVFEAADGELVGDALKAKQAEALAVIDGMAVKVKNRASLLIDWLSGKTAKPNEILFRALNVLHDDGKIATGDGGNLHKNLLKKPYSPSAARAMGRNTITVLEKTKMIVATKVKGEYAPNPNSLFLMMARQMLSAPIVAEAAAEPAVEPAAVDEPVVEDVSVEAAEPTVEEITA